MRCNLLILERLCSVTHSITFRDLSCNLMRAPGLPTHESATCLPPHLVFISTNYKHKMQKSQFQQKPNPLSHPFAQQSKTPQIMYVTMYVSHCTPIPMYVLSNMSNVCLFMYVLSDEKCQKVTEK